MACFFGCRAEAARSTRAISPETPRAPNDEKLRFGLLTPLPSQNPMTVNFFEWRRPLRDVRRTQGLKRRLEVLFGAP
jgi:hypothetical protein